MKKKKNKWITPVVLLVVCAALGAYVLKFERGEAPKEKQVFRFQKADVVKLEVKQGNTLLVLSKDDDQWKIEQPIQAPASKDAVEQLIDRVATLQAQRFVRKDAKLTDADTGLDKPKVQVSVWLKGRSAPETLALGGETPLKDNIYARSTDGAIFTVYSSLPTDFEKKPEDLRDKKLLALKRDDITSIQLTYPDRQIVLEKQKKGDKDEWQLTQPTQAKADSGRVGEMLTSLEGYEAKQWVENAPKDLTRYALDKPRVTVTLTTKDGKQETLLLGKQKDGSLEIYAENPARQAVVTVESKAWADLNKQPLDLQDKHLLALAKDDIDKVEVSRGKTQITCQKSGKGDKTVWKVIIPQELEADKWKVDDILWAVEDVQAERYIEDNPTDLAKYGLTSPQATLRLSGKGKSYEVLFGSESQPGQVYAKTGDSPRVVVIPASTLEDLPKSADDLKKVETSEPTMPSGAPPMPMPPPPGK